MRFRGVLVLVFVAVMALFTALNSEVVFEERSVYLPGGPRSGPLVGVLLLAWAVTLALFLAVDAVDAILQRRGQDRLERLVAHRERELAEFKSREYDAVAERLDGLRRDFDQRLAGFGRLLAERPAPEPPRPAPAAPEDPDSASGGTPA